MYRDFLKIFFKKAPFSPNTLFFFVFTLQLRFTVYQESLWRNAAIAFNKLVPIGVAAVGTPLPSEQVADPDVTGSVARCWPALALVFENFLLGAKFQNDQSGRDGPNKIIAVGHHHRRHPSSMGGADTHHGGEHAELPVVPILDVPSKSTATPFTRRGSKKGPSAPNSATNTPDNTTKQRGQPHPEIDPAQGRSDADLELSVLDTLTDVVLTECSPAPLLMKRRLISVVDQGIARPRELNIPQTATGSNFSHVCVRKMYVLCSRPTGTAPLPEAEAGGALFLVARLALPMFLTRCDGMLRSFVEETRPGAGPDPKLPAKPRLDEIMCVLEVVASMALAPAVVDGMLAEDESLTAVVRALRSRPEVAARGRERTHLLLLYNSLCGCVTCKEPRVREMVRDVLGLAGAELGLGMGRMV